MPRCSVVEMTPPKPLRILRIAAPHSIPSVFPSWSVTSPEIVWALPWFCRRPGSSHHLPSKSMPPVSDTIHYTHSLTPPTLSLTSNHTCEMKESGPHCLSCVWEEAVPQLTLDREVRMQLAVTPAVLVLRICGNSAILAMRGQYVHRSECWWRGRCTKTIGPTMGSHSRLLESLCRSLSLFGDEWGEVDTRWHLSLLLSSEQSCRNNLQHRCGFLAHTS